MNLVYLQSSLSMNGRSSFRGEKLFAALRARCEKSLRGLMVVPQKTSGRYNEAVKPDIIAEADFLDLEPDVVFVEGGLMTGQNGPWKLEQAIAERFVESGGVVVVADVDLNALRQERKDYLKASGFLGAVADYRDDDPVEGLDEVHFWEGYKQIICRFEDMIVSDWLNPIYDGIPEILCGIPGRLSSFEAVLASGNRCTTRSVGAFGMLEPDSFPFATVRRKGAGFVVFIAGNVTADVWLEGCPYNAQWLTNIATYLSSQTNAERKRLGSRLLAVERLFLSYSRADRARVSGVLRNLREHQGLVTWIDEDKLIPGDRLTPELRKAVDETSVFVLFWSISAEKSKWVALELETALKRGMAVFLIVRLEDIALPPELEDRLRIDAFDASPELVAEQIARTVQKAQLRKHITALKSEPLEAPAESFEKSTTPPPSAKKGPLSLTRSKKGITVTPVAKDLPSQALADSQPQRLLSIKSNYRIDILSFWEETHLVSGSGNFDSSGVERAIQKGLISGFTELSCHTGMDGHLSDHAASRRHLTFVSAGVQIVDRLRSVKLPPFNLDSSGAHSAAWSPDGQRVVVVGTNRFAIFREDGRTEFNQSVYPTHVSSVVWNPSKNIIYGSEKSVGALDPSGRPLWKSSELGDKADCVAVSSCGRFISASGREGRVAIWNEKGRLLRRFQGAVGNGYWHASRALAFSADSRLLAQAPVTGGRCFCLFNLESGITSEIALDEVGLLAWSPRQPHVLISAADDEICFWDVRTCR